MTSFKVGRNDPCPCGSGKKYKKCCMLLENIVDPTDDLFTRYNSLIAAVKLKLDEAYSANIKKARNEARQLFLRYTVEHTLTKEYESFFSDWLWFDKTDSNGDTLGFHYLQVNGQFMDTSLKTALSSLTLSYLSVYEVLEMDKEFLKVQDIYSGQEIKVLLKEPFNSPNSLLLLGRLVHMPQASIFSGMVLIMENEPKRKEFLLNHFDYLKELSNDSIANIFKFNGNIIFGMFDHAYKKVLLNLNDIRYAPIDNVQRNKLLEQLENSQSLEKVHSLSDYIWFKPNYSSKGYVRIAISNDNIVLCADILDDIRKLQELICSVITDLKFKVISSAFLNSPPELEDADIWYTIIKDQETERWLVTPLEELEGSTPLEVLGSKNGQNKLITILDDALSSVNTEEQKELIEYMKLRIVEYNF